MIFLAIALIKHRMMCFEELNEIAENNNVNLNKKMQNKEKLIEFKYYKNAEVTRYNKCISL